MIKYISLLLQFYSYACMYVCMLHVHKYTCKNACMYLCTVCMPGMYGRYVCMYLTARMYVFVYSILMHPYKHYIYIAPFLLLKLYSQQLHSTK